MGVKKQFKRTLLSAAFTLGFAAAGTANAFDWLMAQGTEPVGASVAAKPWGFIQAYYQKDFSDPTTAQIGAVGQPGSIAPGSFNNPKLLGPNLNSQSMFNVSHAQFGLRGTPFPLDDHVNYMFLVEAGNAATNVYSSVTNTATTPGTAVGSVNNGVVVTDASVTLNYLEGARIRVGLFKYPGAEEGLQSLASMDYVNFTEATQGLLLERFPNTVYTANTSPVTWTQLQNGYTINSFSTPVGAFRDTGVQVFDSFQVAKDWNMTYAVMVGNGSGIQWDNVDGKYDTYLYLSTEKDIEGGAGVSKHGLKFFAWNQQGQRLADVTACAAAAINGIPVCSAATQNRKLYDRKRSGVGMKYLAKPFRVTAEYIDANGMIFEGQDKASWFFAPQLSADMAAGLNSGATAKGNGWYLDGGWFIPGTKWELDVRYDTADFNIGMPDEHKFSKWVFGTQYNINPLNKVTFNYEMRDFTCTGPGVTLTALNTQTTGLAGLNSCRDVIEPNLAGVGRRLSVQVTSAF